MYKKYNNFIIFLFLSVSYPLNLTLTDYHDPVANHILDAEIINNILIISAMVQGIEFYDISNPNELNHLTNFTLSNGGGGGGGGTKSNCVRAFDNIAYFTSNNGLYVVNISNPSNPASTVTPTRPTPLKELGHSPQSASSVIMLNNEEACIWFPEVE